MSSGWRTALGRGGLAFAIVALVGQALSFAVYFASGSSPPLSAATFARIGWLYFGAFHHVALVVSARGTAGIDPTGLDRRVVEATFEVGFALMLGTGLAVFLLYRAGKAVADAAGAGSFARALHGLKVAPVYAVPSLLLSVLVSLKIDAPPTPVFVGRITIRSSLVQAFLFPLLIAAVSGVAGGLRSGSGGMAASGPRGRRLVGALAGGWRMLVLGLGLSLAGLFVAGAVQPGSPAGLLTPSTGEYFRAVFEPGLEEGAVVLVHHVLLLPNESTWALVPSMGGCIGARGPTASTSLLCYWRFPRSVSVAPGSAAGVGPLPAVATGTTPVGYYLFVLVPLVSVFLGGRLAARRGAAASPGEAAGAGAMAGVVFAALAVAAAFLSQVSAGVSARESFLGGEGIVRVGPDLLSGGLLALAWGVAGGVLGARYEARALPAPTESYPASAR